MGNGDMHTEEGDCRSVYVSNYLESGQSLLLTAGALTGETRVTSFLASMI